MTATENSGLGHGSSGSPQHTLDEQVYQSVAKENEQSNGQTNPPQYIPSPKHDAEHGWGSADPIKSQEEGQKLLDQFNAEAMWISKDGTELFSPGFQALIKD